MSGDWLKMEVNLPEKPEVWQIAGLVGIDPDAVVGKLLKVWRWFDAHTESGNALSVTYALVDSLVSVTGFGEAMALCGWLEQDGAILRCPNFGRHNGKTAKNRALTAKRVSEHKEKSNAKGNAPIVTSALPREEKRREEEKKEEVIPEWLPADRWQDFIEHRKAIRKPMTDKARERMLKHLAALKAQGHDVLALMDTAIRSGWQDVYAPKLVGGSSASAPKAKKRVDL